MSKEELLTHLKEKFKLYYRQETLGNTSSRRTKTIKCIFCNQFVTYRKERQINHILL